MMDKSTKARPAQTAHSNSRLYIKLLIIMLIIGFTSALISLLPRGYSQDLSLVGKGKNVVVLVHDHNKLASLETMNAMNSLRDAYERRVKFVVADLFSQEGKKFAEKYDTPFPALVFFSPNGERLKILYGQQDADTIRNTMSEQFRN